MKSLTTSIQGNNNLIDADDRSEFRNSSIIINGNNNTIILKNNNLIENLKIKLIGHGKIINIQKGIRNIKNLKITSIRGNNQKILIGRNLSCGGLDIQMNDGDEKITIGNDCLLSWGIKMRTSDGHSIIDLNTGEAINLPSNIKISDRVWINEDVKILKGVNIPSDVVVASGSIVTKSYMPYESNTIIAGIPAKTVKKEIKWDRAMPVLRNK